MDKRSLLFLFLMTIVFMGVNTYFSSDRDSTNRKALEQQKLVKEQKQKQLQGKVDKLTAKAKDLPLVEIFDQEERQESKGQGVMVGSHLLFLSWTDKLPSKLYTRTLKDNKLSVYNYHYGNEALSSPQLYQLEGTKETSLNYANLSDASALHVQLLISTPSEPKILLGELNEGSLSVPLGDPKTSALVLFKGSKGYIPAGVYQLPEKHFVPLNLYPGIQDLLVQAKSATPAQTSATTKETLYVLQTPYQQLVFSNIGANLVGLNLPFHNQENPNSLVKEVENDRLILEDSPKNALFPLRSFERPADSSYSDTPSESGYYPLLRRTLIQEKGKEKKLPYANRALALVSAYPEFAALPFEVKEFTKDKIVFEARQSHRRIRKTFSLPKNPDALPYLFNLDIDIEGDSRDLWLSSGVLEAEPVSGVPAANLKYALDKQGKIDSEEISLPKAGESARMTSLHPKWVASCNAYFGVILRPLSEIGAGYRASCIPGAKIPTRLVEIDKEYDRYPAKDFPSYELLLPLPQRTGKTSFQIFAGPLDTNLLKSLDRNIEETTGEEAKFVESQTFHGWFTFISKPISKFLFLFMGVFHKLTNSWAFSIILLTVALRVFLYPLSAWSFKSMKRMQQISPQVSAIQKKYKKEPKKAQIEIMNLYRKEKVNPFMGCLPILIQMPFLIGMFDLLRSTFPLRGASFIPGWINNLAAPDILFQWSYPIFFIGTEFHLLPVLLGVIMLVQQRLSSTAPKDVSLMTDQQRQQRTMGNIMTIFFTIMFYNLPSGLNLYWLSSMLLGILQQWYTNKKLDKQFPKTKEGAI